MRENTAVLLEEMRGKMSAYAFQFGYYLSNLPVKAEAAALLPISVEVDGQAVHLEEVAGAGILDDTHFFFYPVEKKWMPNIEEAILKVHPDYKITHEKIEEAPEDNDEQIVAEVPPVDKDRHQQMKDAVGTFADTCKAQMESNSQLYNSRIAVSLMGASSKKRRTPHSRFATGTTTWSSNTGKTRSRKSTRPTPPGWKATPRKKASKANRSRPRVKMRCLI